ncbi:MAG: Gfo/Idh/MocA family protein [Rhizobiaceae bacterium]
MTINYGIIGCGMMGGEHIRNIKLLDGARVTALTDPIAENMDEAVQIAGNDCRTFDSIGQLLKSGSCDALVIASPNHTHHEILRELSGCGLPILAEKPLCITLDQCRSVSEVFGKNNAPVWVAMEYRYIAPVTKLISALRDGEAGILRMLSIREYRYPFLEKFGDWNRFSEKSGGTMVEKCCHFFDLMRLIIKSEPVRIYASGGMDVNHVDEVYDGSRPDILDNAYVIVDFANGVRALIELCMFAESAPWQERVTAIGDAASIEARVPGPARFSASGEERHAELEIAYREDQRVDVQTVEVDHSILAAGDHHGSTFFQHQRFIDMVRNGGKPAVSLQDGMLAVAMGQAAEESVMTGEAIDFQEFLDRQ